jgi:GNAT superfamily N-acetyltransferase
LFNYLSVLSFAYPPGPYPGGVLDIRSVTGTGLDDTAALFGSDPEASGCSCVWFIIPVRQYHDGGAAANRAIFCELAQASSTPVGLLAREDGDPVGWCAAGPRRRYARAIKTPSYGRPDPAEHDSVWLVPCFYIRRDARGRGISRALLNGAVDLASAAGAEAIEGFPFAGEGRRSGRGLQVGVEGLFASCGFSVIRSSGSRVVMRRELGPGEAVSAGRQGR